MVTVVVGAAEIKREKERGLWRQSHFEGCFEIQDATSHSFQIFVPFAGGEH